MRSTMAVFTADNSNTPKTTLTQNPAEPAQLPSPPGSARENLRHIFEHVIAYPPALRERLPRRREHANPFNACIPNPSSAVKMQTSSITQIIARVEV